MRSNPRLRIWPSVCSKSQNPAQTLYQRTPKWADGQASGRTGGQTDTKGRTDERADEQTYERDGRKSRRTNERTGVWAFIRYRIPSDTCVTLIDFHIPSYTSICASAHIHFHIVSHTCLYTNKHLCTVEVLQFVICDARCQKHCLREPLAQQIHAKLFVALQVTFAINS